MVEAQSELNQGSDKGAGKGKDAQGRGTGGSVVLGATPAVAVGGSLSWETLGTAAAEAGSFKASLGGGECEVTI